MPLFKGCARWFLVFTAWLRARENGAQTGSRR